MHKNFLFKNHFVVLMATGLLALSCSEDMNLNEGPSAITPVIETPPTRNPILPEETYLTDPAKILSVLTSNVYFVYFKDTWAGTQQIAAIRFKALSSGNAFTATWSDISGQYSGVGEIGSGQFDMFISFGGLKKIYFSVLRVVDVYGDPDHPYDVFFDKNQVTIGGGLNYIIDNQKYFDQVDPVSYDRSIEPKLLPNTLWDQVDSEVPSPSKLEFRHNQNGYVFELSSQTGPSFGTYAQDGFVTYGSFNDGGSTMFSLQVETANGLRQMLVIEKRNGLLMPLKKFGLTGTIVM